jgi:hypothetical protein
MKVASEKHLEGAAGKTRLESTMSFFADPDINELAKPMSMPSINL